MKVASLEVSQTPVARQQPQWENPALVERVRRELTTLPPLVEAASLGRLRRILAGVATGQAHVVQAGDCAEDFAECTADDVDRKVGLLGVLAFGGLIVSILLALARAPDRRLRSSALASWTLLLRQERRTRERLRAHESEYVKQCSMILLQHV